MTANGRVRHLQQSKLLARWDVRKDFAQPAQCRGDAKRRVGDFRSDTPEHRMAQGVMPLGGASRTMTRV